MLEEITSLLDHAETATPRALRWHKRVNVKQFLSGDDTPEGAREAGRQVAAYLKSHLPEYEYGDEFGTVQGVDDFNNCLDTLYDYGDRHGVWLGA